MRNDRRTNLRRFLCGRILSNPHLTFRP